MVLELSEPVPTRYYSTALHPTDSEKKMGLKLKKFPAMELELETKKP